MVQGVTGIGMGFLSQLFPLASQAAGVQGAAVIPLRPPSVPAERVLVTTAHDPMDRVLAKYNVAHAPVVDRLRLGDALLAGASYLFVGCGQELPGRTPQRIAEWVAAGGCLMTSDWMCFHLLKAFTDEGGAPFVERQPVVVDREELVRITEEASDPTARLLADTRLPHLWKVSKGSYPMGAIDHDRVTVLARSEDLARRFGAIGDALWLRFPYGRGQVVHVFSHWSEQHFEPSPPSDRPPSSRSMFFDPMPRR